MKNRTIALALVAFAAAFPGHAETFTKTDGSTVEGDLVRVRAGQAYIRTADKVVPHALGDFSDTTHASIEAWSAANPHAVEVYAKWDQQPRIVSTATPSIPESFKDPAVKGMVSVDLVLDESGRVIHASVSKSTHTILEQPSLEAARTWLFEPALIDGKPVKSKLRVPFRFVYRPPEPKAKAADA